MPPRTPPKLTDFIDDASLDAIIAAARLEDVGPSGIDVTASTFIEPTRTCTAVMSPRKPGTLAGGALLPRIAKAYDPAIQVTVHKDDGAALTPGDAVATFAGPLASVLTMERTALNFVTMLSGVATRTAAFVKAVQGTGAEIYDIRKTLPGLRALQKYAVVCGGGRSHRMGLYDAVLIKDNHLAHLSLAELPGAVSAAVTRARREHPRLKFVEIEVDTLEQLQRVLPLGVDIVLLDNMPPEVLHEAVAMRDDLAPEVRLEASGGIDMDTVTAIAGAGVDRIAIGALTHSAPALDLGLDIR